VKRKLAIAVLAISLATPAFAVAPLVAMVITYAKQVLKDKLVSYAKEKATAMLGDSLADVPGAGMLGLLPGMPAPRPSLSAENTALLQDAGFNDTSAKPFTDADWAEYQEYIDTMYKAAPPGAEKPDFSGMRAAMGSMPPQFTGMLRMQLTQYRQMKAERAEMQKAYAEMTEPQRQEVVTELLKTFREVPADEQPYAMQTLKSGALGLPDDLTQRLLRALGT